MEEEVQSRNANPSSNVAQSPNFSGPFRTWHMRHSKRSLNPSGSDKIINAEIESIVELESRGGERVILLGTAHFSIESQKDVAKVVSAAQPDVIMVELCPSREAIMRVDEKTLLSEAKSISLEKFQLLVKQYGAVHGLTHILLLKVSAYVTEQLGVAPGGEFRAAYQHAGNVPGCQLYLGDRPMQVTLRRAMGKLGFFSKMSLLWSLLFSSMDKITMEDVEKMKKADLLEELMGQFAGSFPDLSEVIVNERDTYLCYSLESCVRESRKLLPSNAHPVVVGVVGAGHVKGIVGRWQKGPVTEEQLKTVLT